MDAYVPLLNLDDFHSSSGHARFVAALGRALGGAGYFRLAGHGVDPSLIRAYQDEARPVLRAPLAEKLLAATPSSGGLTGYFQAPREAYHGSLKEDVDMWHVMQTETFPNVWPAGHPGFRAVGARLFEEFYRVTEDVLAASAEYLGYPAAHLTDSVANGLTVLRVIRYPAADTQENEVRFGAHKDASLLTILSGGSAGGLELFRDDTGEWVPVRPQGDELVIGAGDLFEAMTGARFKSALHRVVSPNRQREERYSCPFFVTPRAEVPLSHLGHAAESPEVVYQFLKRRLGLVVPDFEARFS